MTLPHSISLHIRKVIFENFNDVDVRFNNDQVLELLKKNNSFDQTLTIDDLESEFKKIEDNGLFRCIAQNFTTQWYKLHDIIEEIHCPCCKNNIHLGKDESKICPNSECNANL